jgi:GH15 family glucan-1,4-alpha-glucosidase
VSQLPIADYAFLSDCHGAALVSRAGSVDWLNFARFDAPAVCARLLDADGGHWILRPAGEARMRRRYIEGTLALETTFETPTGTVILVDALAMGPNERGHRLGADSPHALLRSIRCLDGYADLEIEYAPRPEYGLVFPLLIPVSGGVFARGGASMLHLSSPVPLQLTRSTAWAGVRIDAGQRLDFALQRRSSSEAAPQAWTSQEIAERLRDTVAAWRSWSDLHQNYEGPWRELVRHSGRVLQGLTYFPTGAIVAAPTTSLPEAVGGNRNWDYRYTWVRDASFTLEALWVAACPDEAYKFFDFLAGATLTQLERGVDMQIMFGIGGEHDLTERELPHLSGWRASRPVRVGNGAWNQRQLDVYGELLNAAYRLRGQLTALEPITRHFLADVADAAARHYRDPDQGIWEIRGPPRDFLYSKLMCWVALDRAIRLADLLGAADRVERWRAVREEIRQAILTQGWSERVRAFTQAFGSDELDASALTMALVGFLPADDPRMLATIDAIERELTDERGLVYRYRAGDGLEGDEGTFLLCTFWLAHAAALAGQVERAKAILARAAVYANDVGLFAEEVDPSTGELLGNFPQAFSHIGLINAVWAIAEAEQAQSAR